MNNLMLRQPILEDQTEALAVSGAFWNTQNIQQCTYELQ